MLGLRNAMHAGLRSPHAMYDHAWRCTSIGLCLWPLRTLITVTHLYPVRVRVSSS